MQESKARYESLFETTTDLIVIMDAAGLLVDGNASLFRVLGYDPADLLGQPLIRIMPARFRDQHTSGFRRFLSTGERNLDWRAIKLPALASDGREIPMEISFGEFEEEGKRYFTGIMRDVTEAKARTDMLDFLSLVGPRLASSSLDYRSTLSALTQMAVPFLADWCAIDVLGSDGRLERLAVAHSDPAKLHLVRELEARYPSDPSSPNGAHAVCRSGKSQLVPAISMEFLRAAARSAEHFAFIESLGLRSYVIVPLVAHNRIYGALSLVHAESGRSFSTSDLPLIEEVGRRAGLAVHNAGLYSDALEANRLLEEQATELEQQTEEAQALAEELEAQTEELLSSAEELRQRTEEASAANQAKSAFLASMSHELRTPLNAIAGYVELLELGIRGPVTEEQRADLKRIRRSQNHLLSLINDVLNFAKVEAGKIEYRLERVSLDAVVTDCEEMVRPQIQAKGIRFSHEECKDPVFVLADRDKLQQIVLNLLTNAIKFTEAGGMITVGCDQTDKEGRLEVTDTGIGIEPSKLDSIFEPFVQIDRSLNQPGSGAGLGLAISRSLARTMEGDLVARSEPGAGSAFALTLPGA